MELTRDWGYLGVFSMMAIESTVFPLPSEIVVPPAAYWARQGHMSFWGVVLAATLGSWLGSAISYGVARSLGRAILPCYLGDLDPALRRLGEPMAELATELWVLTHPDLTTSGRIRAFLDEMYRRLTERRDLFEGLRPFRPTP